MRYGIFVALTLLFTLNSLSAAAGERHLFILSGQSNMARLDPQRSFIPELAAEFGRENVIVVKQASGGQPIRRWDRHWYARLPATDAAMPAGDSGDLYGLLLQRVRQATAGESFESVTFIWMQGERDAVEQNGEAYAASLRGLIRQLEKDLQRPDLNVIIGRLSDYGLAQPEMLRAHWVTIRNAQVAIAESRVHTDWVNTDDLNDGLDREGRPVTDDLHYSSEGYDLLGRRFAQKAIELIRNRPPEQGPGADG